MTSLWPDDLVATQDLNVPVHVLREQAAELTRLTDGKIVGFVSTYPVNETFVHSFSLQCPALDDYSFKLFDVQHPLDAYPVSIIVPNERNLPGMPAYREIECFDEKQFEAELRTVLSSHRVKKVINSLLSQVSDIGK